MQVGDRVRIKDSTILYHHPLHRNEPFDCKGLEGTVSAIVTEWRGKAVSANFPLCVDFQIAGAKRPFKAHLREDELEAISND